MFLTCSCFCKDSSWLAVATCVPVVPRALARPRSGLTRFSTMRPSSCHVVCSSVSSSFCNRLVDSFVTVVIVGTSRIVPEYHLNLGIRARESTVSRLLRWVAHQPRPFRPRAGWAECTRADGSRRLGQTALRLRELPGILRSLSRRPSPRASTSSDLLELPPREKSEMMSTVQRWGEIEK